MTSSQYAYLSCTVYSIRTSLEANLMQQNFAGELDNMGSIAGIRKKALHRYRAMFIGLIGHTCYSKHSSVDGPMIPVTAGYCPLPWDYKVSFYTFL